MSERRGFVNALRRLALTLFILGVAALLAGVLLRRMQAAHTANVPATNAQPAVQELETAEVWAQWVPDEASMLSTAYFARGLDEDSRRLFYGLYQEIAAFSQEIVMPEPIHKDLLNDLIWLIKYDCPELFHVSGEYTYYVRADAPDTVLSVRPTYQMTQQAYESAYTQVLAVLQDWRAQTTGMSLYQTQKYIYDKLINNCTYQEEGPHTGTVYGALVLGKARCEGYSQALSMALRMAGMDCMVLTGEASASAGENTAAKTERHAWNMVGIDGDFYQLDATWDDPDNAFSFDCAYAYFNVTDEELMQNRSLDDIFSTLQPPACNATSYNYYTQSGAYITSDMPVDDALYALLDDALQRRGEDGTIPPVMGKFQSDEQFARFTEEINEIMNSWYANQLFYSGSYSWVTYPDSRVFCIMDLVCS